MTRRKTYLDWLRGVAVLIMIEAHTLDSWTSPSGRGTPAFGYAMVLGGFGAPLFLFLAGVAVSMSAGSKYRQWADMELAVRTVKRRGWQIFGLAFLFRLQSYVLNPGAAWIGLLKVDILNVMGPSIIAAADFWGWFERFRSRVAGFVIVTIGLAMVTPLIRSTPLLNWVPDPVEWYIRPVAGRTNFTLFPWAGFVFAGALVGLFIDRSRDDGSERRVMTLLVVIGALVAALGYGASFLPPIYRVTSFWTSSPTFFFLRCGILALAIVLGYLWESRPFRLTSWQPLVTLGMSSLFVYWIHVEMVYGYLTRSLHHKLEFTRAVAAFFAFAALMYLLVLLKDWVARKWRSVRPAV